MNPRWYLDTSAAVKFIVNDAGVEPFTTELAERYSEIKPELVACYLLETELRRAVQNRPDTDITQYDVTTFLHDYVDMYEVPASVFRQAGLLQQSPGKVLRSLDAIHIAAALRLGVDAMLAYDTRLLDASVANGLLVEHPGLRIVEQD